MPEREDDHLTPATRLLEKRREMAEVEQALAAQKEVNDMKYHPLLLVLINYVFITITVVKEFQMKMESLQQRREELEKKEYQLKESLLKFDKFLKENDIKRTRAEKKAHDEKELSTNKQKEIER